MSNQMSIQPASGHLSFSIQSQHNSNLYVYSGNIQQMHLALRSAAARQSGSLSMFWSRGR